VLKFAVILALALPCAFPAAITFTELPPNVAFGTYNGFAMATIDGLAEQALICDDFLHTTYVPSPTMIFYESLLVGPDPLAHARFSGPGEMEESLLRYRRAAWLVDGLSRTGANGLPDRTADYQYALWSLFTPSVLLPSAGARSLLDESFLAVEQGFADPITEQRLRIYTPAPPFQSNQEFLGLAPPTEAPEPEPALAVLTGIAAIVIFSRMRRP
jgi:hypothetical protein